MSKIRFGSLDAGGYLEVAFELLRENHFAIEGRIGQRKTLLLISLLLQFVRLPNHAVIFIDLGGDQAAFWLLKEAAEKAGKPFCFFSLGFHDCASWDPLLNTPAFAEDLTVAAAGLSQGLRLEHGEGYGRTFWARLSTADINQALESLVGAGIALPSFPQFAEELKRKAQRSRVRGQVSEASLATDQLLRYRALSEKRSGQLFLGKVIEEGGVCVFHLPTALQGGAARAIASFAGWCTTVEAAHRVSYGRDEKIIHLAIDEFPQIAASKSSVEATMAMARKWNVHMYPVFQDRTQLQTPDGDMSALIKSQCQRIVFTADSFEAQEELRYESKDIVRTLKGQNQNKLSISHSIHEYLDPELTRNEILEINGISMKALGVFKLGDQHRNPIPFTVIPPTRSIAHHRELKNRPLPALVTGTTATVALSTPSAKRRAQLNIPDPDRKKRQEKLAELATRITAEQTWRKQS